MAVEIEGVAQHAVPEFLAGLAQASEALGAIPARLEAARVHDVAFGKLFDAAKVRDAYHQRLPASEENIFEARQLINHFIAEFGGTPLELPEPVAAVPAAAAVIPVQAGEAGEAGTEPPSKPDAVVEDVPAEGIPAVVTPDQKPSADMASADVTPAQPQVSVASQADGAGSEAQLGEDDEPTVPVAPAAPEEPAESSAPVEQAEQPEPAEPVESPVPAEPAEQPDPAEPAATLAELIPGQAAAPVAESIPDEP